MAPISSNPISTPCLSTANAVLIPSTLSPRGTSSKKATNSPNSKAIFWQICPWLNLTKTQRNFSASSTSRIAGEKEIPIQWAKTLSSTSSSKELALKSPTTSSSSTFLPTIEPLPNLQYFYQFKFNPRYLSILFSHSHLQNCNQIIYTISSSLVLPISVLSI